MIDTSVCELSAVDQERALRRGSITAVGLMAAFLERIAWLNPAINAIVSLDVDRAIESAEKADAAAAGGEPLGLLHGLPLAVKDLMDTAGLRTTYGSPIYADHVPTTDSLLAQRLRDAGGLIIAKTNVPEFGAGSHTFNPVFGVTRNPYDLGRSAGGSSGGAGAALAARLLPVADGSDLGGSIRNPASFANLFGLRPTAGRVASARPGNAYDPASVLGPLARSVEDLALLFDAIAGPDDRAPLSLADERPFSGRPAISLRGARVAFSYDVGGLPVEASVLSVMQQVRVRLEAEGAEVTDVELPLADADFVFETFRSLEFFDEHREHLAQHAQLVKRAVRDDAGWGAALTIDDITRAGTARTSLYRGMQTLFGRFDLVVAPTSQVTPFDADIEYPTEIAGQALDRYYEWQRSCSRITATGMPVLAAPGGFTDDGLPVGIQFVGPARAEARLIGYGVSWQRAIADVLARKPTFRSARAKRQNPHSQR
ncbi:amidase family protein [Subtercola endophyticus]|uniref:amidase family protein n=1 Tax=Subtercola endophyticus TaxID=2895559 RepID=UPI001E4D3E14|nr:amidase family protein [Subtercola endophyticus]UFS58677.1 amidase [Subtercola endophyticus]